MNKNVVRKISHEFVFFKNSNDYFHKHIRHKIDVRYHMNVLLNGNDYFYKRHNNSHGIDVRYHMNLTFFLKKEG